MMARLMRQNASQCLSLGRLEGRHPLTHYQKVIDTSSSGLDRLLGRCSRATVKQTQSLPSVQKVGGYHHISLLVSTKARHMKGNGTPAVPLLWVGQRVSSLTTEDKSRLLAFTVRGDVVVL